MVPYEVEFKGTTLHAIRFTNNGVYMFNVDEIEDLTHVKIPEFPKNEKIVEYNGQMGIKSPGRYMTSGRLSSFLNYAGEKELSELVRNGQVWRTL